MIVGVVVAAAVLVVGGEENRRAAGVLTLSFKRVILIHPWRQDVGVKRLYRYQGVRK